jgi:LPS export ABC transporter protein LptC
MRNLASLLFLLAVTTVFAMASCSDKPEKLVAGDGFDEPEADTVAEPVAIAQELRGVRYSQSKGDKLLWRLDAKTVEQADGGPVDLQSVEITYYGDDGGRTVLTADVGLYDAAGRDATLRGNVIVETSDGGRVETSAVHWDQDEQKLSGEGEVILSRGDSIIMGKGFELLPEGETVKILEVTGIVHEGDIDL